MSEQNNHSRRVTVRDIAKELGVSHTTISLALRNNTRVSEKLRKRIQQKAREMGYSPDPMLSALSNYRLKNMEHPVQAALAWINPWDPPEKLRSYRVFDLYWQGAYKTARKLGYHLEEFTLKDIPLKRLEQILITRNIRGILIPMDRSTDVSWDGFDWSHFATVRFGRTPKKPHFHLVTSAQMQNSMMAFNRIREKGYERIGFVGEKVDTETFGAGFFWAQQQLPRRQQLPLLLLDNAVSFANRKKTISKWIDKNNPDAIYTRFADLPEILSHLGYRVPEDIALAATSVIDTPIDAGIDQNSEEVGRTAVLALASLINDSAQGIPDVLHEYLIQGKWVDGASLPNRRGEGARPKKT